MRYEDFVLHIGGKRGDGYAVRVLDSPAGEGVGRFVPPMDRAEIGAFYGQLRQFQEDRRDGAPVLPPIPGVGVDGQALPPLPTDGTRDIARRRRPRPAGPTAQEVGQRLFDSIFHGQVAALYDRSLGALEGRGEVGLRLKLRLDSEALSDEELGGLPWELMYRQDAGRFLGLDRQSSIVRYLDVPRPSKPIPLPEVLRVLVVMAEPEAPGLAALNLEAEFQRLQGLSEQYDTWQVEVERHASVSSLRRRLAEDGPFHIVHFMGHGGFDPGTGEGLLYFEGASRSAQPISGRDLASKLLDFDDLGLVFLNACETASSAAGQGKDPFAGVAAALVRGGLPAVIAMQRPISDTAAIAFSDAFYTGLARGACADQALVEGRQAIHSTAPKGVEWMIPVFFARIRSGAVFERPEPVVEPKSSLSRNLWMVASALLFILLMAFSPIGQRWFGGAEVLALDQVFATSVEGVNGLLKTVELMPDGTMRLHFEFTNETDQDQKVGLDFARTYLADEMGHAYEVIGSSGPLDAPGLIQTLGKGETRKVSIDMPAPLDGARKLGVALAETEGSNVSYPFFEVKLPAYPKRLSRRSEPRPVDDGVELFDSDHPLDASVAGLDAQIDQIELKANQSMRWTLAMINRTKDRLGIDFDGAGVTLVDNLGRTYRAKAFGAYVGKQYFDGFRLRRGLRAEPWFDFGPPKPGATSFTLRLATKASSGVRFGWARVELHGMAPEPESELARDKNLISKPLRIPASPEGFEVEIVAIEALPSNLMRLKVALRNLTGSAVVWGLDYPKTYVSDFFGRRYDLLDAVPTVDIKRQGFRSELQPDARAMIQLDVQPPFTSPGFLTLWLRSSVPHSSVFEPVDIYKLRWPTPRQPANGLPRGAFRLIMNKTLKASSDDFDARLESVDLFKADRMRFNFRVLNRSRRQQTVGWSAWATALGDAADRGYRVLGHSPGAEILPGLGHYLWIETESPRNRASSFELTVQGHEILRQKLQLTFSDYPQTYSQIEVLVQGSGDPSKGQSESSTLTMRPPEQEARETPSKQVELATDQVPSEGSGSWKGYFRDAEGQIYDLQLPLEKNSDNDWMTLEFTEFTGNRSRIAIWQVQDRIAEGSTEVHSIPNWEGDYLPSDAPLQAMEEMLTSSIFNTNRFEIIERSLLGKALAEHEFAGVKWLTLLEAAQLGRGLGADYLLFSRIYEWTPKKKNHGAPEVDEPEAEVALSVRVVDTETTEVAFAGTFRGTSRNQSIRLPFFGQQDISPVNYALTACLNKAVYNLATGIELKPWRGAVVDIIGDSVILDGGENRGVTKGQVFQAVRKGKEMIDPESGKSLGFRQHVIGSLRVTDVDSLMATAVITEGGKELRIGDVLLPVQE